MKQKTHFTKLFQVWGILLILGIALSITIVDITTSLHSFKIQSEEIRTNYIASQKQTIQQEVMRVVEYISYEKAQSVVLTKHILKHRIYEASAIAENIYKENKATKTKEEIKKMII
ncbi:MAG: cache domain-containing protein, partial [Desulfocapsa sp.]|nr:cache domain-containing protein [Desulfocapsa sp.]